MKEIYTTGELAKLCNVTKRTVQYYDEENIVKPSKLSEGGRRIYSIDDVKFFQLVCLYRNLGLSLKDIKCILKSENSYKKVIELLTNQEKNINNQIDELYALKKKIITISDEIHQNKKLSILSDNELKSLQIKKDNHKIMEKKSYILLIAYILVLFSTFIIGSLLGQPYLYVAIGMNILFLFVLIYFHSSKNAYICPCCSEKFTIGFFRDLFTLNNGKKGKYLKCPNCQKRNWIAETYK